LAGLDGRGATRSVTELGAPRLARLTNIVTRRCLTKFKKKVANVVSDLHSGSNCPSIPVSKESKSARKFAAEATE